MSKKSKRKSTQWAEIQAAARQYLVHVGFDTAEVTQADIKQIAFNLEREANIPKPLPGQPWSSVKCRILSALAVVALHRACTIQFPKSVVSGIKQSKLNAERIEQRKGKSSKAMRAGFFQSFEWKKLRYSIILKHGRKCMCCGETKGYIHVDHIKPISKYWQLRKDPNNLQVLCEGCNQGKSNWDETDFRGVA